MKSFVKNFVKFCSNKIDFKRGFILITSSLVIYFSFFYFIAVNKLESLFINQTYQKEELAVLSGADSIHTFLEMTENSLLLLSRNSSIVNQDAEIQKVLDEFALDWAETAILGAARFDKDGVLRFAGTNIDELLSTDDNPLIKDRDYFVWAETATEGDTYLGKPLMPRVGLSQLGYIFPYITPIYKNGEFDGILLLPISLSKLTATYLNPLKVSPNCIVYLIHPDGTVLASSTRHIELVGVNYFEYLRNKSYSGSEEAFQEFTKAVKKKNIGKLDLMLFSVIEKKPIRFIITLSPVIFNNKHWTLGLAVPFDDINTDLGPFKKNGIMFIFLYIAIILTMSIIGFLIEKIFQRKVNFNCSKEGKINKN